MEAFADLLSQLYASLGSVAGYNPLYQMALFALMVGGGLVSFYFFRDLSKLILETVGQSVKERTDGSRLAKTELELSELRTASSNALRVIDTLRAAAVKENREWEDRYSRKQEELDRVRETVDALRTRIERMTVEFIDLKTQHMQDKLQLESLTRRLGGPQSIAGDRNGV